MQECPHCAKLNANKQTFCGSCGELVFIDPGFEKKVRLLLGQERKRSRSKIISVATLVVGLASYFGHQYVKSVIADAIAKATPVVEKKIEAHLNQRVTQELPAMIARSEEQQFPAVARQLDAVHKKRIRALEAAYQQQSTTDEERFKATLAAAQPTLRTPTSTYPFQSGGDALLVSNNAIPFPSSPKGIDVNPVSYVPSSWQAGLPGALISSVDSKSGADCFLTATLTSTTVRGVSGSTMSETSGCKDRLIIPMPSNPQPGLVTPIPSGAARSTITIDPATGGLKWAEPPSKVIDLGTNRNQ